MGYAECNAQGHSKIVFACKTLVHFWVSSKSQPSGANLHPQSGVLLSRSIFPLSSFWLVSVIVCLSFARPAAALDGSLAAVEQFSARHQIPPISIEYFGNMFCAIGLCMVLIARGLLGPLVGITSVLWVMMRNDPAIKPKLSWMMFGVWLVLFLSYVFVQCHRVLNRQLYMLLSTSMAGICMCIIALIQKSSLHGGLMTAIPPCSSFAAYSVGYFFPDRLREGIYNAV
ncbi:uncharacterized protein BDR25DRAFT_342508 [Lindgomyces ingoldianus]|uniref:Uncharacterized protein n=1 Tax=Lindgomyces ingoldianus TaxID=673940 RepID=A0ACB6QVW6_9PLEO|nr:uncharacterized protein BDR25DRAFT_342508 [Lindgomyces ingoldianus]KAF2471159.1 hypothetical protein BDR25DRAFT_342508 [Lindgomyces ingoldianus]